MSKTMSADDAIRHMSKVERDKVLQLALGRIFAMGARATQPGDAATYEKCRALILACTEIDTSLDFRPNYARDHKRGAAGD